MHRQRGLTIIECLIAMTILSVIVLVTCHTLAAGHQHIHHGERVMTAARLGRDMLEEIGSRAYRDPDIPANFGLETGETTRGHFDDVDDYHGYTEPAGTLSGFTGVPYSADDQSFARAVTVTQVTQTVSDLGTSFPGVMVAVTVRAADGQRWRFTRFVPEPGR